METSAWTEELTRQLQTLEQSLSALVTDLQAADERRREQALQTGRLVVALFQDAAAEEVR